MTPLWFAWTGGRNYTYCRGQKVANLRRNPRATILVDKNERFPEPMGAMFGEGHRVEDTAAEAAEAGLEDARMIMGTKYAGGHGGPGSARNESTARGRNWRWVGSQPKGRSAGTTTSSPRFDARSGADTYVASVP